MQQSLTKHLLTFRSQISENLPFHLFSDQGLKKFFTLKYDKNLTKKESEIINQHTESNEGKEQYRLLTRDGF